MNIYFVQVSFVPPDGDFELMRYTVANLPLTANIAPIYCKPVARMGEGGMGNVDCTVGTKPGFSLHSSNGSALSVENVSVDLHFPPVSVFYFSFDCMTEYSYNKIILYYYYYFPYQL